MTTKITRPLDLLAGTLQTCATLRSLYLFTIEQAN
jgi:hypothetical protein